MVEEPAIPAVRRSEITIYPRLLFSYRCSLSSNDPLFVSRHSFLTWESLFHRPRRSLWLCFSSLFDSSRSADTLTSKKSDRFFGIWQICSLGFVTLLLCSGCSSPSSECSSMPILPGLSFSWSCYCLSRSHCRLVRIAIPVNSRNLVHKSSYFDEPK